MLSVLEDIDLKPNKPKIYDCRSEFLIVNTWLYTVEQYLQLLQRSDPSNPFPESEEIVFCIYVFNLDSGRVVVYADPGNRVSWNLGRL